MTDLMAKSVMPAPIRVSRRQFLRILAIGGSAGLALRWGVRQLEPHIQTVSETRLLMGTIVNLTVLTDDRKAGEQAISACFDRMAALEGVLSRFRPDSALSTLNRLGILDNAPQALIEVLLSAKQISQWSSGAFDITVKPLLDQYLAHMTSNGGLPAESDLQDVLRLVDYRKVEIRDKQVRFSEAGVQITLDGIAKGYIVDAGITEFKAAGFPNVMVEAGGDLSASGAREGQATWRIGIQSPRSDQPELLAKFSVHDQAVATSGDYLQVFTKDFTRHHILDPLTGLSSPHLASATVLAENATSADGLATALMVLTPSEGLSLVESLPGVEAYLVTKEMCIEQSSGFPG